jgi:hypothetical protein
MKKLILLLICPAITLAQRFDVGLNCGPAFFTTPSASDYQYQFPIKRAVYSNLIATMHLPKSYNIGIKIGGSEVKADYTFPQNKSLVYATQIMYSAIQGNKQFEIKRVGGFYFGILAGFASYNNLDSSSFHKLYKTYILASSSGRGYILGGQIGYDLRISRHFALNIEADVDYVNLKAQNKTPNLEPYKLSYITYPITIGAKYTFGVGKYKFPKIAKKIKEPNPVSPKKNKPPKERTKIDYKKRTPYIEDE